MNAALHGPDLLVVADSVAREKSIEPEQVIEGLELAIQKAASSKYGMSHDIRAKIDRKNGNIELARYVEIVEDEALIENVDRQMTLSYAQKKDPKLQVGQFIIDVLPPIDFGRIAAQGARQVISQHVYEAERKRQYEEYKNRVGEIINGIVKRIEYGSLTIDLGRAEAVIPRSEIIPREHHQRGDRIRAYIYDVRQETRGAQIFLSRTHPQFMSKLFLQEVPEIYDGIIEIKSIARDPGSRAKIAVLSHDPSIDPVGACVGMRGSRVQAVVSELQGEKVDIVPWNPEIATFVVNALAPAEVTKVVLDEDTKKIEIIVADEQLSIVIGRRGQNVRLASILTGWHIDVLTEQAESKRREQELQQRSQNFMETLDVDDVIARLLVSEGFSDVEELTLVDPEELLQIENFDESIITELQKRAHEYLEKQNQQNQQKIADLGLTEDLLSFDHLTPSMLVALGEKDVKTLEDFADLSIDELLNKDDGFLRDFDLDAKTIGQMITNARIKLGWISEEK
ncbi:MAG: transcription termination factor NusA [Pseudomonadota bacterium]